MSTATVFRAVTPRDGFGSARESSFPALLSSPTDDFCFLQFDRMGSSQRMGRFLVTHASFRLCRRLRAGHLVECVFLSSPPHFTSCSRFFSFPPLVEPSTAWLATHLSTDLTFTAPSWWGVISPPARSWSCNGSGKDGWSIDWQGNTLPSTFPSGWLWFG